MSCLPKHSDILYCILSMICISASFSHQSTLTATSGLGVHDGTQVCKTCCDQQCPLDANCCTETQLRKVHH
jgi:hypothetical protein